MPVTGLEPVRYRYRRILSPLRLPIPSHRQMQNILYNTNQEKSSYIFKFFALIYAVNRGESICVKIQTVFLLWRQFWVNLLYCILRLLFVGLHHFNHANTLYGCFNP